jgi:nitroimidazol reductase NimA-like FMN-containing flavoprotein (pyridoxamine 5'-phosphate oxidase superfamily)
MEISAMEQPAIAILDAHQVMAISTVRPDGWPQTTFVGYANEGFTIFFLIFRSSQKFANIRRDDRISVAVGEQPADLDHLQAVYASARASEVTDQKERDRAWELLVKRHPNLADFDTPNSSDAVMMRATCEHVSVLDYTKGFGHSEQLALVAAATAAELVG